LLPCAELFIRFKKEENNKKGGQIWRKEESNLL